MNAQIEAARRQQQLRQTIAEACAAIMVRGRMVEDAQVRIAADQQSAFVFALVAQPYGMPYLGVQRFDADGTSLRAAHAKRQLLRKGAEVTMYGTGLEMDRASYPGREFVLRIQGNADIRPVALPDRQEQAESTSAQTSEAEL